MTDLLNMPDAADGFPLPSAALFIIILNNQHLASQLPGSFAGTLVAKYLVADHALGHLTR